MAFYGTIFKNIKKKGFRNLIKKGNYLLSPSPKFENR